MADSLRRDNIRVTCIGVGDDLDENILDTLAIDSDAYYYSSWQRMEAGFEDVFYSVCRSSGGGGGSNDGMT